MSRIRLCSFLLAGLSCWLFLSGCISVDIHTKAARNLSGTRTYRITLEPMLARVYRSGASAKMFDFPGQDLENKKGIIADYKKEDPGNDGSLVLEWSYRAKRLADFSGERDTVLFSKRFARWWIYYSYYEHYLPRKDTTSGSLSGSSNFTNRLTMPGQIYSCNGDSLAGSTALWTRSMTNVAREGLVMQALSREINPLLLVLLPLLLGGIFYLALKSKIQK